MKFPFIRSERQQKALEYALKEIKASPLSKYIKEIYLYGSCARGEESFDSDVDICVVLKENTDINADEIRDEYIMLKLKVKPRFKKIALPDVDLKVYDGNDIENEKSLFFRELNKDKKRIGDFT